MRKHTGVLLFLTWVAALVDSDCGLGLFWQRLGRWFLMVFWWWFDMSLAAIGWHGLAM
ncbi:hypothetical protein FCV25MIE_24759, partial [Fagus crenata]